MGQYIDEAVNSILQQTFQDFEIIIVNDGSTDKETNKILNNYNKPEIKVITTENRGRISARNTGIENSKGKYIFPLDADDKTDLTYLEKAINIIENNSDIGIVYSQAEFFGARQGVWNLPPYSFPQILVLNCIFNSALFRKSDWQQVGGYNLNMKYGKEDRDFWLSIIESGLKPYRIEEILFYYRVVDKTTDEGMTDFQKIYSYLMLFYNHKKLYLKNLPYVFKNLVLEVIRKKLSNR